MTATDTASTETTLVLLRHGQSTWNLENLFTGWVDVPLTDAGIEQARNAGELMASDDILPTVVHTSLQRRAVDTANLALSEMERGWIPVRRSWRLNERHYGALQGKNKKEAAAEHGADQVFLWRRSYDIPPPLLSLDDPQHPRNDPRYADLAPDVLPAGECLKDVVDRMLPYWFDDIVPDLRAGHTVLVAAHGNSLRALVKHLEDIADADIAELDIPTGFPRVYTLDGDLRPLSCRYLGDAASVEAAAAAVARQAG
ncbi:MAG: phosphoglycerate mutase [Actinomycetia bacterium]|nr:phosphoglycerate mutase [Actinomycetes bacterium]